MVCHVMCCLLITVQSKFTLKMDRGGMFSIKMCLLLSYVVLSLGLFSDLAVFFITGMSTS